MKKTDCLYRLALCLWLVAGLSRLAGAQTEPPKKVKIGGAPQTKTIVCIGEEVLVSGDRHQLTLKGHCFSLTVYGDRSTIEVESVRLISLHGNKNTIRYNTAPDRPTKVLRFGRENRVVERPSPNSTIGLQIHPQTRMLE